MSDARIGNCSGFYGDRLSAMREMVESADLDYLTGDYLAELTMLILGRDVMKDASTGYAKTFVRQMSDCMALAKEKGITKRAAQWINNPSDPPNADSLLMDGTHNGNMGERLEFEYDKPNWIP